MRYVIDADPGIDDAMAIIMALEEHRRGNIQVEAITLVEGNTTIHHQKTNIVRIMNLFPDLKGKIPVYVGCHEGLVQAKHNGGHYHGNDGFNDVQFEDEIDQEAIDSVIVNDVHASLKLVEMARGSPGSISVITLGPLTNIALCTKLDPNFLQNVNHFYMMGGSMECEGNVTACAEFNFYADPEAAHVVLSKLAEIPEVKATIVTWELCLRKIHIDWDWRLNSLGKASNASSILLGRVEAKWHENLSFGNQWVICDQLAMAVVLNNKVVKKSHDYFAFIELHGTMSRGMMGIEKRVQPGLGKRPNIKVILEVDQEEVKNTLMRGLCHEGY